MGSAPNPDTGDLFEISRGFPLAFDPLEDEGAQEECHLAAHGALDDAEERQLPDESDADAESESEANSASDDDNTGGSSAPTKKQPKQLNAVQKVGRAPVMFHCVTTKDYW